MIFFLKRKLNRLGAHADPHPLFMRTLEKRLNAEIGHRISLLPAWRWVMSAASVLALVGGGTAVYAYTSDKVLPDHPLYGVRTSLEHIEESLAPNTDQKTNVGLKIIKRRLHEVEVLTARKKSNLKQTKRLIKSTLDRAHKRTLSLPEPEPKEAQDAVSQPAPQEEIVRRVDLAIEATEESEQGGGM